MYEELQQRPGKYMPGKFQYMHGKLQYMTGKLQPMPGKLHNMPGKLLYIISQESYSICTPGKDTEYIYAWKSYSTYTVCLESGILYLQITSMCLERCIPGIGVHTVYMHAWKGAGKLIFLLRQI